MLTSACDTLGWLNKSKSRKLHEVVAVFSVGQVLAVALPFYLQPYAMLPKMALFDLKRFSLSAGSATHSEVIPF